MLERPSSPGGAAWTEALPGLPLQGRSALSCWPMGHSCLSLSFSEMINKKRDIYMTCTEFACVRKCNVMHLYNIILGTSRPPPQRKREKKEKNPI